ncbi:hypothetical protein [Calidithermus chliarophilus]|uniref:hypothetical protein n=1 Tax=Calidithermus chliarophilus TaxID=52023 RepID=UPI000416C137|nr:hypothetical protein [Calidithermus chliarophilus]
MSAPAAGFGPAALRAALLGLLGLLAACSRPPATAALEPFGSVTLAWDTTSWQSLLDSSRTVRFTPLSYTDLDALGEGVRYLTLTYRVENLGSVPLENLTLQAYARAGNAGGTAIREVRAFPDAAFPDGQEIADPGVARSFRPVQATVMGVAAPQPDPLNSDFQAFALAESAGLEGRARALGLIAAADAVLDYGFTARDAPGDGRRLGPGEAGTLSVAFRLPRTFPGEPKPYRFKATFLVGEMPLTRVSRALGETTAQALGRARGLAGAERPVQLVLVGPDADNPAGAGIGVVRLENLRIGTAPTYLLP